MFDNNILLQEIRLTEDLSKSVDNIFDIDDLVQHKIQCCLDIDLDNFDVIEVIED